jgi:hypothetical protein
LEIDSACSDTQSQIIPYRSQRASASTIPAGNRLFTLCKDIFSIPKSDFAEPPADNTIFESQGKFRLGGHLASAMNSGLEKLCYQGQLFANVTTEITK